MSDLISRQAAQAIKVLPKCYRNYQTDNLDDAYEKGWEDAMFSLNALSTIGPVKHGKWLPHPTEPDWDVCSVCGIGTHRRFHYNDAVYGGYDVEESFTYCPHCGAKMEANDEAD